MKDRNNNNRRPSNQRYNRPNSHNQNTLPSARTLEDYENVTPGATNKLLEMAKKEQDHRHSWQDRYLKSHNFSYRLGQVFGIIYNLSLLYVVVDLVREDKKDLALDIFVANAALILLALLVTTIERKIATRKPPRRMHRYQNNRDQNRDQNKERHSNTSSTSNSGSNQRN